MGPFLSAPVGANKRETPTRNLTESTACFDVPNLSNFTSDGVQNRKTKNRTLGMIVTSFQDFKLREKQISPTFSYCGLINSLRNGTIVHCL